MQTKTDAQLLGEYAAHHSEPAFTALVARHTDLIYSAALRQTGSPELAREIAQGVFTDLARKAPALAGTLSADASLAGWLFRGTRFAGLKLLRDDQRRQTRERQFMEDFNPAAQAEPDSAPDWKSVAPVLDEAMAELDDADHEAILLRYFKNQDFHVVGLALGVSDDAAQKRVSRAVERLREFFAKRGVTVGASGLVVLISANGVLTAPAGLSAALAAAAVAGTTLITATVGKAIAMTTLQKTLITAVLAVAVGIGIYEARQVSALRNQVNTLQQQAALTEQVTRDHEEATRRLAALRDENDRLNRNTPELLRLRGEVTALRRENVALSAGRTNNPAKAPAISETPEAIYAAIGAATPEAGLQRMIAATKMRDTNNVTKFLGWLRAEDVSQDIADQMRSVMTRQALRDFSDTNSVAIIRIVNTQMENNDVMRAFVEIVDSYGRVSTNALRFAREGDEWKPAVTIERNAAHEVGASVFQPHLLPAKQ